MTNAPDILITGGGVIGLTAAYYLAQTGAKIEIVDRGDFGGEASWAGAGILPPGNPALARLPFDRLRALSASVFHELSTQLRDETGIDNGYLVCGGIELGDVDLALVHEWREEGVALEELDASGIRRLEPALQTPGGYFFPDMAQVRNPRHVKALVAACAKLGVRFRTGTPVTGLLHAGGKVQALRTPAGNLGAGKFLVTAGAWTDSLLAELGCPLGIRPIRGQIALLRTTVPILRWIVLSGKRYLVPRPDGRVLVGSTEEDAGFDKRTTAEAIGDLLRYAVDLVPDLGGAQVERTWAGLRPGSADGLPSIGPLPGFDNLWVAAGHFRSGIQLSPATGMVVRDLLLGRAPPVAVESFRVDRPRQPAAPMAFRS